MNFVLTLSNGKEISDTLTPDMADAVRRIVIVYFFYPVYFKSSSLASLYDTNWDELTAMALVIVGMAPVHKPLTPYYLPILTNASTTFL